jgi:hypothetical protein
MDRQLERLALKGSVERQQIYHCGEHDVTIPQEIVEKRKKLGFTTVLCPVGGEHFLIDDLSEPSAEDDRRLDQIDASAEEERARQERLTVIEAREKAGQYDVFLCHNSTDKADVRRLAAKLREQGLLTWLDEEGLLAGDRFVPVIERLIESVGTVAVVLGPHGLGRWQGMEYQAALQRFVEVRDGRDGRRVRLIPVLLPGLPRDYRLPPFLGGSVFIDLRKEGPDDRDQIRRLVAAIRSDPDPFQLLSIPTP